MRTGGRFKNQMLFDFAVFLACFVTLVTRAWDRLSHAQLWAEDGAVFVTEAYRFGWRSLWIPYAGYFHSVPRLISLFTTFAIAGPNIAFWMTLLSTIVFAACISYFAREEFAHLIPSQSVRAAVAIALCFVSGMTEGFGNVTNLHWILTFWLGLLALRPLESKASNWTLPLAWLAAGSGGESVVLIPFYAFRLYLILKRKKDPTSGRAEATLLAIVSFWAIVNFLVRLPSSYHEMPGRGALLQASIYTFLNHFILQPVFGDRLTAMFGSSFPLTLYWVFSLSTLTWYIFNSRHWKTDSVRLLWLAVGSFWGIGVIAWIFRGDSFHAYLPQTRAFGWYGGRWALHMAPMGLILASTLLPRWKGHYSNQAGLIFVAIFIVFSMHHFKIPAYSGDPSWAKETTSIQCPVNRPQELISIPIQPVGWSAQIPVSKLPCLSKHG